MGRLKHDQGQFFYSFRLNEAVPCDHPIRQIASVLDLSWVHLELAPFYPNVGRPSIDPVLMIRMLIVSYAFAIRSERALCRDLQVNLAYRWFWGCPSKTRCRTIWRSRARVMSGSARAICSGGCLSASLRPVSRLDW